jgi:hypothetical protein
MELEFTDKKTKHTRKIHMFGYKGYETINGFFDGIFRTYTIESMLPEGKWDIKFTDVTKEIKGLKITNHETTNSGWVIIDKDGNVQDFTFNKKRSECIKSWLSIWSYPNWTKDKKNGYKCVKAKNTIITY